jgi:hypothetical protein
MSFLASLRAASATTPSLKYGLLLVAYMSLVRYLRYRRINSLLRKYPDPTLPLRNLNVAKEVSAATGAYEFPYVNVISLEFALFKTYAIPSISKILAATKQFAAECPKRVDDTGLILCEITEVYKRQSYRRLTENKEDPEEDLMDAKRAQVAIEKLNFIHGHYPIRQEDYLYTLSLFVLEPVQWINRLEWRQITDLEKNVIMSILPLLFPSFLVGVVVVVVGVVVVVIVEKDDNRKRGRLFLLVDRIIDVHTTDKTLFTFVCAYCCIRIPQYWTGSNNEALSLSEQ